MLRKMRTRYKISRIERVNMKFEQDGISMNQMNNDEQDNDEQDNDEQDKMNRIR